MYVCSCRRENGGKEQDKIPEEIYKTIAHVRYLIKFISDGVSVQKVI
jgi:hypothetical protein